jgi:hypothetical protein
MELPPIVSEQDFVAAVEKVASALAKRFACARHPEEDVRQEVALLCLEAVHRFDPARGYGLENFLYIHGRNRVLNILRRDVSRADARCAVCHDRALYGGPGHPDGTICPGYTRWAEKIARSAASSHLAA